MRFLRTPIIRRVVALSFVLALVGIPAAVAQTPTSPPYPGTPTTSPGGPTSADIDLGLQEVGAVLNVSVCNFAPGTAISLTVNGTTINPPLVAGTNGCATIRIEVLPNLVALGSPLHPLAATGLAQTANKIQVRINGQTLTVGPHGTVVTGVARGTGSNGFERTVTFRFTVVRRGTISRSGLVRTGTTVIKWTPFALGLVGVGYLLLMATRRRREQPAES
ncbi:MAG TPA: hypothetical protein VMZ22_05220 [Acidimicrobiales bacterium]|nr:hypothetical protein [Acidimicrobiales bacterium]